MGPFGNGYFIRYIATLYIVLTACGKYLILRVHTKLKKKVNGVELSFSPISFIPNQFIEYKNN